MVECNIHFRDRVISTVFLKISPSIAFMSSIRCSSWIVIDPIESDAGTTETLCIGPKTLANRGQFFLWAPKEPTLLAEKVPTLFVAIRYKYNRLYIH